MDAARLNLVREIFTGMNDGANRGAVTGMTGNNKLSLAGITATSLGDSQDLIRRRVI